MVEPVLMIWEETNMKTNLIIGKKQIILASLVLILGVAVYLNWTFANTNDKLDTTNKLQAGNPKEMVTEGVSAKPDDKNEAADVKANKDDKEVKNIKDDAVKTTADTQKAKEETANKGKNLGDAQLVNARTIANETYFVMAKLSRTKSRDEAIQTISTILDDAKLTEIDKKEASKKAMTITDRIEAESRIENLIKAKGFEECMVYISDTNANVVVKTAGLDQNQATQIKNIVIGECKVKGENVSICEVK